MRILACTLLWCSTLWAQTPAPPKSVQRAPAADASAPEVKPEDKCSIAGTVVSATGGQPLKKAQLVLYSIGQRNGTSYGTTTDAGGHFELGGIDPGQYSFWASRNEYVNQDYSPSGNPKQSSTLTLTHGQKLKDVVFKLIPQGVITGKILDGDGDPVEGVAIQAMSFHYIGGKRQLTGENGANTNDLGEFRLYGLKPGKYLISATYQSMGMNQVDSVPAGSSVEENYTKTFYPGTPNREQAAQLEVTPGAQISGIDFTLARVRTVRIQGRVTGGPATMSRRNTMLTLEARDATNLGDARTARVLDGQGNFRLRGVAPGSYVLHAVSNDDGKRYGGVMPLEVGSSNIEGIELSVQPPLEISGRVVVEAPGALKNATVVVVLMPKGAGMNMSSSASPVKDDLTFRLSNVGREAYDVMVRQLPEGFYVKSVRLGERDVTDTGLDLTQGAAAEELTVVVNPNGGEIDGQVENAHDEPAAGASVTLVPDATHRTESWLYKTAATDQNGRFAIKGIRPGDYKIYAWEEIEAGAQMDPDFLKPHESDGEAVSVKEGARENLQLKAIPAAKSVQ